MADLLCNCYHSKEDHRRYNGQLHWCQYSEIGQCPCDYFTQMSNLEYLEYEDAKRDQ